MKTKTQATPAKGKASGKALEKRAERKPAAAPAELMPVARIPLERIKASATNPRKRFDEGRLAELAETIKTHGMLQPVIVRPTAEGYELVAGERRFRAAALAGEATIPAVVRDLDDMTARKLQVIENEQREDLTPIEKAAGYREVLALGVKVEDLGREIGKSPATIYGLLRLLDLPTAAQEKVEAGLLPASTAELLARIPSAKLREQAFLAIACGAEVLSFRDAKQVVRERFMVELKQVPFDLADANILPSAGACTSCRKLASNNRQEFPDGRGDVCTDPPCFERKKLRAEALARAAAAPAVEPKTPSAAVEVKTLAVEVEGMESRRAADPATSTTSAISAGLGSQVEDLDAGGGADLVEEDETTSTTTAAAAAAPPASTRPGEDLRRNYESLIDLIEEKADALQRLHQEHPQRKALDELLGLYVAKLRWEEAPGRKPLGVFRGEKGGEA